MLSEEHSSQRFSERLDKNLDVERDPFLLDEKIEAQQETFWSAVDTYSSLLIEEKWETKVLELSTELIRKAEIQGSELENQAKFFGLVTAVESRRSPSHSPTWEQAAAALHILHNPEPHQAQRILMATGEGKTFVIAMASLWEAKHGRLVTIHTDKQANVEQSYNKTKPLYQLFRIKTDRALDLNRGKPDPHALYKPVAVVRYGTWSQFMHEYLNRRMIVARTKALIDGDTEDQRSGKLLLTPEQKVGLQRVIANQEKLLFPALLPADEGDKSLDQETSEVVLSEQTDEAFSDLEEAEVRLAWQLFTQEQTPEALQRIAETLNVSPEVAQEAYQIRPEELVEGLQDEEQTYVVTSQGVEVSHEQLFYAQVMETLSTPSQLVSMLEVGFLQLEEAALYKNDPEIQKSFTRTELIQLLETARAAQETGKIAWSEFFQVISPVTRSQLRQFFGSDNPLFNYNSSKYLTPEVKALLKQPTEQVTAEEWQKLELVLPDLKQLITVVQLFKVVEEIWMTPFNECSHSAQQAYFLSKEGDNYRQIEVTESDPDDPNTVRTKKAIELLSEEREPEPNKKHHGLLQAFLHLKHGLPLPEKQRTVAQILPATFYQLMAERGVKVASISGTQDNPDYVVPSTGEGTIDVLRHRVFPDSETKLRAITYFVGQNLDRPILLCAQNYQEFQRLQESLASQIGQEQLIVIDAAHADDSYTLVPQLEAGKVVLLQLSARGLDFGRLLESEKPEPGQEHTEVQPQHSFENGLVISANELTNPHQQKQLEGRLGGKRPDGEVVTFTSLDDEVAEQRYKIRPTLIKERQKTLSALDQRYQELLRSALTQEDIDLLASPSFTEVVAALDAVEDGLEVTADSPLWLRFVVQHSTLSPNMQEAAARLQPKLQAIFKKYESVRHGHITTVEYQQTLNIKSMKEQRRQQVQIDRGVQNLWQLMMDLPKEIQEGNQLAKVVKPLTFEKRLKLMEQVFESARFIYMESTQDVKKDQLESDENYSQRKYVHFFAHLIERVIDWVNEEKMDAEYVKLRDKLAATSPFESLPENLNQLQEWLKAQQPKRNLLTPIFLGLRQMAYLDPLTALPQIPEAAPLSEHDQYINTLKELAAGYQKINRKYRAEL